jgi:hypothetical protein
MKRNIKLSYSKTLLLVLAPVVSTSLYAAETIVPDDVLQSNHAYETVTHTDKDIEKDALVFGDGWKVSGDIRAGYVAYDYSNPPAYINSDGKIVARDPNVNKGHADSKGFYIIPKVSITSPEYKGFSFKITGAGVTDLGINDPLYNQRTFAFGAGAEPYAILQEAYVQYDKDGHTFSVGARESSTPMVDADDWYLLANTFQSVYYRNKVFENIPFAGAYVYKMDGVWDSGADGANYHSIADTSYVDQRDKDNAGDAGMWVGVFQYENGPNSLQLWDYYAVDLYNTFFGQYDYSGKFENGSYDAGAQLIDFQGVGALASNNFTEIDYSIFSLKLDGKLNSGFDMSLGMSFYTDGPGAGATLGAWGGYPYLANGMIFHFFEAGNLQNANTYKAQFGYDLSKVAVGGLWIGARYTYFDLDPKYSKSSLNGEGQDFQHKYGLRVSYDSPKGYYFTGTYEYVDLDQQPEIASLRLIGGYKF